MCVCVFLPSRNEIFQLCHAQAQQRTSTPSPHHSTLVPASPPQDSLFNTRKDTTCGTSSRASCHHRPTPTMRPQFPPLHYQQPPTQRFDFTHSIEHFPQTTPFAQASAFHPQQQHQTHQQANANTNHRLMRQREQLQRLDSTVSQFSPDLVNGHFPSHSRRHDPIRLSNEPMDILPPHNLAAKARLR